MVGFLRLVCNRITADGMESSSTKSICNASSDEIGERIACGFAPTHRLRFQRKVKSLGVGLGAGRRRHTGIVNARLKHFRKRLPRFRMLRRAGVNTARVLRTGGVAALVYGQPVIGTSPALLLQQRRAVSHADALAGGMAGQNLDVALLLADGPASGKADQAYAAHDDPIHLWALAVWSSWMPRTRLQVMVVDAKVELAQAARPWAKVYGVAAGFVATASRLKWLVHDAFGLTTDEGRTLQLDIDPPIVIGELVAEAVRRWRWRQIEVALPSLHSGGRGLGACMRPIWKLLNSRERSLSWNPELRGALRSAIAGRQWPQVRCFRVGNTTHSKCLACA